MRVENQTKLEEELSEWPETTTKIAVQEFHLRRTPEEQGQRKETSNNRDVNNTDDRSSKGLICWNDGFKTLEKIK